MTPDPAELRALAALRALADLLDTLERVRALAETWLNPPHHVCDFEWCPCADIQYGERLTAALDGTPT
jgi:hypothetical protein